MVIDGYATPANIKKQLLGFDKKEKTII